MADTGGAFAVEEPFPIHVQQVINGSKVNDHHALLPTKSMANADLAALPAGERNVLRLIAARLLCAVGEPHRYAETTLTTICAGEEFSAKGKVMLSEGWKAMEQKMLRCRGLTLFQFGTGNAALALLLHIRQNSRFFLLAQQLAQHF